MPQVLVMFSPKAQNCIKSLALEELAKSLVYDVENVFGLEFKNDVAFSAINLVHTLNEADVQVEIRYTAGDDEYGRGQPFDPPMEDKKILADQIKATLMAYLFKHVESVSVWIIPFKESLFQVNRFD